MKTRRKHKMWFFLLCRRWHTQRSAQKPALIIMRFISHVCVRYRLTQQETRYENFSSWLHIFKRFSFFAFSSHFTSLERKTFSASTEKATNSKQSSSNLKPREWNGTQIRWFAVIPFNRTPTSLRLHKLPPTSVLATIYIARSHPPFTLVAHSSLVLVGPLEIYPCSDNLNTSTKGFVNDAVSNYNRCHQTYTVCEMRI